MTLLKSGWRLLNPRFTQCALSAKRNFAEQEAAKPSLISVETDSEGIATVTLQRKPVNSLNLDLLTELGEVIGQLEKDKARGLILTSACDNVFCAGLDILEMYKPDKKRVTNFWSTLQNTWLSLYSCSMPSAAAITGHSPAGGCLLSVSCEYRVMVGPKFAIGMNETQLGIIPPPWFMKVMNSVIGPRQVELALTKGTMFSAEEALKVGLVDEVVSTNEEAVAQAKNFIQQFRKIPRMARTASKLMVRQDTINWMRENQMEDITHFISFITQDVVQESLKVYMERLSKKKE